MAEELHGLLIGKAGQHIRAMQKESGAQIKITANARGNGAGQVQVYGSPEQRRMAKCLIRERIASFRANEVATEAISVPRKLWPMLIGAKHTGIAQLQKGTGAQLHVPTDGQQHICYIKRHMNMPTYRTQKITN